MPDLMAPRHWLGPRKEWLLLRTLVDKLKLPTYGWSTVDSFWCPHHKTGTKCTTGMHTTFIPPEDHRDEEKAMLDSQAAVFKWTRDFPREDREDNAGLEFKCQLAD